MSIGSVYRTTKPRAFRPTPKADDVIKAHQKAHPELRPSESINELLESIGDKNESRKRGNQVGALISRVLVLCRENERFVTKEYCEKECQKIIDCPIYSELLEAKQHPPLDVQTKKEE